MCVCGDYHQVIQAGPGEGEGDGALALHSRPAAHAQAGALEPQETIVHLNVQRSQQRQGGRPQHKEQPRLQAPAGGQAGPEHQGREGKSSPSFPAAGFIPHDNGFYGVYCHLLIINQS